MESLKASGCAFAALRRDGRVVTWGCGPAGGDSSEVGTFSGSKFGSDVAVRLPWRFCSLGVALLA